MKKKNQKRKNKPVALLMGLAASLTMLCACGDVPAPQDPTLDEENSSGIVRAFYSVSAPKAISQTAIREDDAYLVTVITSSSVTEYSVNENFEITKTDPVVGDAPSSTALTSEESDLGKAFKKALSLAGILDSEVEGFDFDKEEYLGKTIVYKVKIEDAAAEYTYLFSAQDLSLIESRIELKNAAPSGEGSSYIGEAKAKEIALGVSYATEALVHNLSEKSYLSDGRRLYRVEYDFDGYRYTVDIDAVSGEIAKISKFTLDENVSNPEIGENISEEEAKRIALNFAFPEGTDGKTVSFRKIKLEYEKGQFIYEVEFVKGSTEYEMEISARDGTILDVEIDAENEVSPLPQSKHYLTREEAIQKVQEIAGAGAVILEVDIEKKADADGKKVYYYEVETDEGGVERNYYVNATTGEVTSIEPSDDPGAPTPPKDELITEERALAIALEDFVLSESEISRQRIKLEREDGRLCYEIEFYVGYVEYSMTIDAQSGTILEREIEGQRDDTRPSDSKDKGEYLTREEAIAIALEHFKLSESQAKVRKVEFEKDDGRYIYEVEFKIKDLEYTVEIDAVTGAILESDISYD